MCRQQLLAFRIPFVNRVAHRCGDSQPAARSGATRDRLLSRAHPFACWRAVSCRWSTRRRRTQTKAKSQTKTQSQTKPAATPATTPAAPAADAKEDAKEKEPPPGKGGLSTPRDDPFPSTYKAPAAPPFAIRNATLLTAAGPVIPNGTILVRDGKIVAVGAAVDVPAGTTVIDAGGR